MKYHIEKSTVQETLVLPLFGRLICSEMKIIKIVFQ